MMAKLANFFSKSLRHYHFILLDKPSNEIYINKDLNYQDRRSLHLITMNEKNTFRDLQKKITEVLQLQNPDTYVMTFYKDEKRKQLFSVCSAVDSGAEKELLLKKHGDPTWYSIDEYISIIKGDEGFITFTQKGFDTPDAALVALGIDQIKEIIDAEGDNSCIIVSVSPEELSYIAVSQDYNAFFDKDSIEEKMVEFEYTNDIITLDAIDDKETAFKNLIAFSSECTRQIKLELNHNPVFVMASILFTLSAPAMQITPDDTDFKDWIPTFMRFSFLVNQNYCSDPTNVWNDIVKSTKNREIEIEKKYIQLRRALKRSFLFDEDFDFERLQLRIENEVGFEAMKHLLEFNSILKSKK